VRWLRGREWLRERTDALKTFLWISFILGPIDYCYYFYLFPLLGITLYFIVINQSIHQFIN